MKRRELKIEEDNMFGDDVFVYESSKLGSSQTDDEVDQDNSNTEEG